MTTEPISAPPVVNEEVSYNHEPVKAEVSVRRVREIMIFSDRYNYNHFYKMPAHVGMQNVPSMVSEMIREGCKLGDIQISFEIQEVR